MTVLLLALMMWQVGMVKGFDSSDMSRPVTEMRNTSLEEVCSQSVAYGDEVVSLRDIFKKCGKSESEPIDVPAIKSGTHLGCPKMATACIDGPIQDYSCADKSRILLTAENGTKHCIKF